jgi:hypothetical protein
MTNLTQPRYLVIADYPNSPFNVGNILTQYTQFNKTTYWVNDNLYTDRHPEDYPHLFRLLHWWEYRNEKEMPEYVRFESLLGIEKPSYEHIVAWDMNNENGFIAINKDVRKFHHNAITPATLNEYNEYIKTK